VFSPGKEGEHLENSFKNGISFTHNPSALGEVANALDLTIRTSIIDLCKLKQNGIGLFINGEL
jgi:dTDP-4-dehydrorhamnose reductase